MVLLVTSTANRPHFSAMTDFSGERISGFMSYEELSLPSTPFPSTSPYEHIAAKEVIRSQCKCQ